jgi:hypothetical protein
MPFSPRFWTTTVGSFSHLEVGALCARLVDGLQIPCWPQLPRRAFQENMYVQFSAVLPAMALDEAAEKISFDPLVIQPPERGAFVQAWLAGVGLHRERRDEDVKPRTVRICILVCLVV